MFQRKTRRFGRRTNGRNNMSRNNLQIRSRPNIFSNEQTRNKFRPPLSAEKSFEKYSECNAIYVNNTLFTYNE